MDDKRKDCPMRHESGNCLPAGGFCTAASYPICEALHNAFNHVEHTMVNHLLANGVTVQQWIPVSERLPENEQWVLCIMGNKDFGEFRVFQWSYIDWEWNDGNEWFAEEDVTHWMPRPEPPKEG